MKTLLIDIETTPNLAHVWGLWQQNVGLNQLMESTEMLSFAAKWLGEKPVLFASGHHDGRENMVAAAHRLLDQADAVVHFNGKRFDVPHLNREFLLAGYTPPSPFKQIDLLEVVKRRFKFPSNKLAYVSKQLGLPGKVEHEGHELWVKCMAGDEAAWNRMRRYNKRDVTLLEDLYHQLLPWIQGHPNVVLYGDPPEEHACPRCGGLRLTKQGFAYTQVSKFQQYRCSDCGAWSRSGKRVEGVDVRGVTA